MLPTGVVIMKKDSNNSCAFTNPSADKMFCFGRSNDDPGSHSLNRNSDLAEMNGLPLGQRGSKLNPFFKKEVFTLIKSQEESTHTVS